MQLDHLEIAVNRPCIEEDRELKRKKITASWGEDLQDPWRTELTRSHLALSFPDPILLKVVI